MSILDDLMKFISQLIKREAKQAENAVRAGGNRLTRKATSPIRRLEEKKLQTEQNVKRKLTQPRRDAEQAILRKKQEIRDKVSQPGRQAREAVQQKSRELEQKATEQVQGAARRATEPAPQSKAAEAVSAPAQPPKKQSKSKLTKKKKTGSS
ncbi:MAG: hypothetical protein JXB47_17480 [Anaerolineae bacterium]|nr:hypothetical protein [Anaerolineae bacterium]